MIGHDSPGFLGPTLRCFYLSGRIIMLDVFSACCPQNNALFMRLDSFLERCHDILDLTQTIVQFSKLAKIEVGGTKGNTLTASVKQVFREHHMCSRGVAV